MSSSSSLSPEEVPLAVLRGALGGQQQASDCPLERSQLTHLLDCYQAYMACLCCLCGNPFAGLMSSRSKGLSTIAVLA